MSKYLISLICICAFAATAFAACSDTNIRGLVIDTTKNVYGTAATVALEDITVRTIGNIGQFIATGAETVTVSAPGGYTLTGTTSGTTSSGALVFSGLQLTSTPAQGTFYLEFDLCGGVRVDRLEVVITAGSASKIVWFTQPENSITSFGYFPLKPILAMADGSDTVTDLTNYDPWTLTTDNAGITLANNVFTPNSVSGQLIPFEDLQIQVTPAMVGTSFQLQLASIGSLTAAAPGGLSWPSPVTITVANCTHDFTITPADSGATLRYFNIPHGSTANVGLRGWNFMSSFAVDGKCRYNGLDYPFDFVDLCNINCKFPADMAVNNGYPLELSLNGVSFETLGTMTVVDMTTKNLVPDQTSVTIYREDTISAKVTFRAQDGSGNRLHRRISARTISCSTQSIFANAKRITAGTFYNPRTSRTETLTNVPTMTDGEATVDFAFGSRLEPDTYRYCCVDSANELTEGCVDLVVIEECTSPPVVTGVSSAGCTIGGGSNLIDCKTQGTFDVIVNGSNFGPSGATIRIGPYECTQTIHDPNPAFQATGLIGKGCKGAGSGHNVYVFRETEKVWAKWANTYSFGLVPTIDSIAGCPDTFYPSTANCEINGSSVVTVTGTNFGASGASLRFYYFVPQVPAYIEASTISSQSSTQIVATGFNGTGSRFEVAVLTSWGEETRQADVTMTYQATVVKMCPIANGIQCNGKGTCNTLTGFCACFNDDTQGRWVGSACDACQDNYWGTDCTGRCPGINLGNTGADIACSGVARGTCNDGISGTGTCNCASGYGGLQCEDTCPGGASSPCSNRGTCLQGVSPAVCNCTADAAAGFWGGADCFVCAYGYVGATCTQKCPTHYTTGNAPCSNQGLCASTSVGAACICNTSYCGASCQFTGTDCGNCPAGQFGTGCVGFCPGYSSSGSVVCTGHGICQEGTQGSGQCICDEGYSSADCSIACPKFAGLTCGGNGKCSITDGKCTCNPAFAGSDCSISCPQGINGTGICSGNGICNSGATGDGKCTCNPGFTGALCDLVCPGGVDSPCSFHGKCELDQTCTCNNDTVSGFWGGSPTCSSCSADWYGPNCNGTCVRTNGLQCAGNGQCSFSLDCICYANAIQGYWAEPNCSSCKPNYWGAKCQRQCPGGACNACSNHGTCWDGLSGNGTCTCHSNSTSGYWTGAKCSDCQSTYFGETCTTQCPMGLVGPTLTPCTGHGTCSEGVRGNGTCLCLQNDNDGYWGGTDCSDCKTGYYGTDCKLICPGTTSTSTCSGHGTCNDGQSGTGQCVCDRFFGTTDCSTGCYVDPATPTTPCSGHGTCDEGSANTGTCSCYNTVGQGFWDTDTCGECVYGYYGASCISECPKSSGVVCAGHGLCNFGTTGDGNCNCELGYATTDCSVECEGGAATPCSNHGTCDQSTGQCTCFADPTNGFFSGSNCSACDPLYESPSESCTIRCPIVDANPTVPCNGHGTCIDGTCVQCDSGWCGDRCELTGFSCDSECPPGYYGLTCTDQCPGYAPEVKVSGVVVKPATSCFENGLCSAGLRGNGKCNCFNGYFNANCSGTCLPSPANPCSGHGTCDRISGACQCSTGYETDDCSVLCPGGVNNVCSGNGTCNKQGQCDCLSGYARADCSEFCPGASRAASGAVGNICSNHGVCHQSNASCTCHSNPTDGFWTGASCDECQPGYHGASCKQACVNGTTVGTECVCNQYWSGASCDMECPGLSSGSVCSGQGNCTWGNQYTEGFCTCDTNYYTKDCSVFCSPSKCSEAPYFLVNGKCDNATGDCACAQNEQDGFWADTTTYCTTCKLFYWGPSCKQKCPCMQHGGCTKDQGVCQCFDTDAQGHFEGNACERCKAGFIGSKCKGKDVVVTRQRPCSSITTIEDTSQFILMDEAHDVIITGARPIIVCNLTTKRKITEFNVSGSVVSGTFENDTHINLVLNKLDGENSTAIRNVIVERSSRPNFAFVQSGSPYIPTTYTSGTRRQLQTFYTYDTSVIVDTVVRPENPAEKWIVMSNGVIQHVVSLEVVGEYNDWQSKFDQVQSAAVTDSVLIDPSYLILSGSKNGVWQMIAIPLPLSNAKINGGVKDVMTMLETTGVPYCLDGNCKSAAKVVTEGTYVVAAMLTSQGAGILRFRFTQLDSAGRIETNAVLEGLEVGTIINVTAMILDPLSGAGFVAMNSKSPTTQEPSTIYKFDLLNLQVYGSVRFQKVVDRYEVVTGFTKNDVTRTLYATVPLEQQLNVVPLNLYAVTKVYPNIADIIGGTLVTVEGEGFLNDPYYVCNFNGTDVAATFVSTREAHCVAPAGGDERCEGTPLEISVGVNQYTKNDIPLRRVSSPRITSVDPTYGNLTGGIYVDVVGTGFQNSSMLACKFTSDSTVAIAQYADRDFSYSDGLQGTQFLDAVFVNATMVRCRQPLFTQPTRGQATIEVTLDGNIYSTSGRNYEVIGQPTGINSFNTTTTGSWTTDFTPTYKSESFVYLRDFHVFVVDKENQRLRTLDSSASRQITMEFLDGNVEPEVLTVNGGTTPLDFSGECDGATRQPHGTIFSNNTQGMKVTVDGYASFSGMRFPLPRSGTYKFLFRDLSTGWNHTHIVKITVGDPMTLMICKQPPEFLDNLVPALERQPKLFVLDEAGNQLPAKNLNGVSVLATYNTYATTTTASNEGDERNKLRLGVPVTVKWDIKNETRVAQLDDNFMKFEGLEMRGLHGQTYTIDFTGSFASSNGSTVALIGVTSNDIQVKKCRDNTFTTLSDANNTRVNRNTEELLSGNVLMYFAMLNTSECFVCPYGAICDGSTDINLLLDNLWRPDNESYTFYSCDIPYSGNSCLRPHGQCKEGYEGPRCSVCSKGYGKDGFYCIKCQSKAVVASWMLLIILITLAFVTLLVYTSFTASLNETLPVLIKIGINHLQISSRVNEIVVLPSSLRMLFNAQLQISELIRFDLVSTECPPLELTVYGRFYLVLCIPLFMMVFYAIVYSILGIYRKVKGIGTKCIQIVATEKSQEVRRDRVMLTVAKFMSRIRAAAFKHHGDLSRDEIADRPQFYTPAQYFVATVIIILFLVYPTVLQWCASMWRCDDIVYGHGGKDDQGNSIGNRRVISYLERDRSIECTDSTHQTVQYWSLAAALVYGLGCPILSILVIWRHWNNRGRAHTRKLFAFIMTGFDMDTWWWEGAVMARKALIVFIIIFIKDETLRVYLAMWTMAIALGAHGWFQPYDPRRPSLYYLEGLGITTIVVTLNLSLLFQFDEFKDGTDLHTTLVVFLFGLNILVGIVFLVFIAQQVVARIRTLLTGEREESESYKSRSNRNAEGTDDVDMGNLETQKGEFAGVTDRRTLQREGILGALKRASKIKELQEDQPAMPVINPTTLPPRAGETPFERVQRMEQERQRAYMRHDQAKTQVELEEELEELRDRLVRAQALAAAEEAVIARNPEMAIKRQEHEDQLMRLMDEIRRERGELVVKENEEDAPNQGLGNNAAIMQSIQFEDEEEEVAFENDEEMRF